MISSGTAMPRSDAPGDLETVRRLLNTWEIANETHAPVDLLAETAGDPAAWRQLFGDFPRPRRAQLRRLRDVRDAIRTMLSGGSPDEFNRLIRVASVLAEIGDDGERLVLLPVGQNESLDHRCLVAVVRAVADGSWQRLRACRDCRWVFFDHTRSHTRAWCGMYARGTAKARACGSIAKVRAYRARQRDQRAGGRSVGG
jgi:predicted RNA-binding Zn ribbon-like protein